MGALAVKQFPYFKWYPADAEGDEAYMLMSDAELGFYHRCLNRAWINDGLPGDLKTIARMFGKPPGYVDRMWKRVGRCFCLEDGRYRNPRQEEERTAATNKSNKASSAATAGAKKEAGWVYLVKRASDTAVKIGSSKKVSLRLAQLRYKYQLDALELVWSCPVENMWQAETTLQNHFWDKRVSGEWYTLAKEDITLCITLMGDIKGDIKNHPNNHPIYARLMSDSDSDSDSPKGVQGETIDQFALLPPSESDPCGWKGKAFERFWAIVWAKIGKDAARSSFKRKAETHAIAERIIAAAKRDGPAILTAAKDNNRSVLHPSTWLNQGRYDDEPVEEPDEDYEALLPPLHRAGDPLP